MAWTQTANIKGDPGTDGADGTNGTNGTNGTDGARGSKWFTGSGAPASVGGSAAGDFYLDTATGDVYVLS